MMYRDGDVMPATRSIVCLFGHRSLVVIGRTVQRCASPVTPNGILCSSGLFFDTEAQRADYAGEAEMPVGRSTVTIIIDDESGKRIVMTTGRVKLKLEDDEIPMFRMADRVSSFPKHRQLAVEVELPPDEVVRVVNV